MVVATLALAGCSTATSSPQDTAVIENDPSSRPGSAAVYQRIESSTDCVALQREFDIAMDNSEARPALDPLGEISESYANAADNRMEEIGCYG